MKLLIALLSAAVVSSTAGATQTLRSVSWTDLAAAGQLQNGRVLRAGELDVEAANGAEATLPIFELKDPRITAPVYALTGEVRYDALNGRGYLEMWSTFADGGPTSAARSGPECWRHSRAARAGGPSSCPSPIERGRGRRSGSPSACITPAAGGSSCAR